MGRHAVRGKHRASGPSSPAAALPDVAVPPTRRPGYTRGRVLRVTSMLAVAGTVAALTLPLGADAAVHRAPVSKVRLPPAAELAEPYVAQDSCDPTAKPGVIAFRALMLSTYRTGTDGGISRACSARGVSEHKEGRAWDWMLDAHNHTDAVVATSVLNWLIRRGPHGQLGWNARRFGIMYIIWDGRIWGAYRAEDGWRPYVGVNEHTDHVHFSFGWNGALKRTSWWTGHVASVDYGPCPTSPGHLAPRHTGVNLRPCGVGGTVPPPVEAYAKPGQSGPHVLSVQRALHVRPLSGLYGPRTVHAVAMWQLRHHLRHTGIVDLATARAMRLVATPVVPYARPGNTGPRVLAVQRALHVHPLSGFYGAITAHSVAMWQLHHHLAHTGIVDLATAQAMNLVPRPPAPVYARPGDHGARVSKIQRVLHIRPVSGFYGVKTTHAVALWQLHHHLAHTGIVDAITARAMHL